VQIRLIKSPTRNTIELLADRILPTRRERILAEHWGAVLLVQAQLPDLYVSADVAEKAAPVVVEEIKGTCPQHVSMIAAFGDTAAVEAAARAVREMSASVKA
jgi:hypothetical protein